MLARNGFGDITLDEARFVELAGFDHSESFFGISSAEAFHVSRNIRLSKEIAFEASENANRAWLRGRYSHLPSLIIDKVSPCFIAPHPSTNPKKN
jgi:hypothetical protein